MNTIDEYGIDSIEEMNLNHFAYGDYSLASGNVRVYFRQLKARLIEHINRADMIIGSVAWLTDLDILQALASKPTLITVQKEDFLRPDMVSRLDLGEKEALHNAYESLGKFDGSKIAVGPFFQCVQPQYRSLDPIVCFGVYKEGEMYKTPRLHHKFLVFLTEKDGFYYPTSVWTGSMNLTRLSEASLENAVVISDEKIATAFALEAQHIYLLGEPLDWTSEWISPFQNNQLLPAMMPFKTKKQKSERNRVLERIERINTEGDDALMAFGIGEDAQTAKEVDDRFDDIPPLGSASQAPQEGKNFNDDPFEDDPDLLNEICEREKQGDFDESDRDDDLRGLGIYIGT